ncbi:hypothetical protein BJ165DRAFT_1067208 [Panaeolus papilionaceus]|nr:hypothetical protein BJ165DRAFT_1067208 [Panaeolus papilionaceus]
MIHSWVCTADQIKDCCLVDLAEFLQRQPSQASPAHNEVASAWVTKEEAIEVLKKTLSASSGNAALRFCSLIDITLGMVHQYPDFIQSVLDSKLHLAILESLRKLRSARPELPSGELLMSLKRVDLFFNDCYNLIKDHDTRTSFVSALSKVPIPPSVLASGELSVLFAMNMTP